MEYTLYIKFHCDFQGPTGLEGASEAQGTSDAQAKRWAFRTDRPRTKPVTTIKTSLVTWIQVGD